MTLYVANPNALRLVSGASALVRGGRAQYVLGASGPTQDDCSGMINYLLTQMGHRFPYWPHGPSSRDWCNRVAGAWGSTVTSRGNLLPGDLVIPYSNSADSHIQTYGGGGRVWEAASPSLGLREWALYPTFLLGIRLFPAVLAGGSVRKWPTLSKGDRRSTLVKELQRALNARGCNLKVDGVYGNKTAEDVNLTKRNHGWRVDGIAGQHVCKLFGINFS